MTAASDSRSDGVLTLTYYGHCAFQWQTEAGFKVLADPYRNIAERYWFTRLFPEVECDLGLITHAHFDHDAAERLQEGTSLIRMPGEFSNQDMNIKGNYPRIARRGEVDICRILIDNESIFSA